MPGRVNRFSLRFIANRAGVGLDAGVLTGRSGRDLALAPVVALGGNNFVFRFFADRAGISLFSVRYTAGFGGNHTFIPLMVARGNFPLAVCIRNCGTRSDLCSLGIGVIGVVQLGGGDGDLMGRYSRTVLGVLIGYSLRSDNDLLLEHAGTVRVNICAACRRVDCPVYGQHTVDIHLSIHQIRICAAIGLARSILHHSKFTAASIAVRNPLVTVIDIDAVAAGNNHFSALRDIGLHTRQQSRRLVDGELAAPHHVHSHVVCQGQNIILGADPHTCQRKVQIVDFCLAVHGIDDTVGRSVVLLSQAAGNHLKHTIVSHKGNHGIVDAAAGKNSSVHLFTGVLLQYQSRFDILHIILAERKYLIAHTQSSRTAAEVRDLIPLVDRTARFHGNRASTGHKTPSVQITTIFYNDGTICVQPDLAIVTGHITGRGSGAGTILPANAETTPNGELHALCQSQALILGVLGRNTDTAGQRRRTVQKQRLGRIMRH